MIFFHRLGSILAWILRRDRAEQRLDEEMRAFVDLSAADKISAGVPAAEARRLAILELGGVEQAKEQVRTARDGALLDDVGRDVRQSLRLLARQRTFTVVIVLTLALGIGANTAIFSIVDSLLLRTLPVKDPDRLAVLVAGPQATWTYPIWEEIQRRADLDDLFEGTFAWSRFDAEFNLSQGGESQLVSGVWASAGSFTILGVRPLLGRTFVPADDVRGGGPGGPVAVISFGFWQRHFGGVRDVVGRTLMLDRVPFTIVGVTPREFRGLTPGRSFDVAIPLGAEPLVRGSASRLDRRTSWWLSVMVRLKRGQTVDDATATLRGVQPQIRGATLPATRSDRYLMEPFTIEAAATGRSGLRDQYQQPLLVILVVVGLVLLIACTNIANLLLARATARGHEWSVRLALGASPGRLVRQLLIESLILAAAGATAGLVVAKWASELLVAELSAELDLSLDWRVLAFTAAAACLAALVFGVAPALRAARGVPIDAMKDRGRSNAGGGRITAANGLVLAQVVLSVVLVVCAGLFLRTFSGLVQVPLGFDRDRVLVTEIDARRVDLTPEARLATYDRIRERVRGVPGVSAAGISMIAPLSGRLWSRRVEVSGSTRPRSADVDGPEGIGYTDRPIPDNSPLAIFNAITPGWMATYGTPLLAGRDLSGGDGPASPRVALVNQAFARKFLDGANPVGHIVQPTREPGLPAIEIVGLVRDSVFRSVREPMLPVVYVPLAQAGDDPRPIPPAEVALSVRADSSAPEGLAKAVAAAVGEINSTLPLTSYALADQVSESLVQEKLLAMLSAAFGTLALVMAAVGLYGVTSYAVSLRRSEIGIRMALGATRAAVMRLVLTRVSLLVGAGITVGLALAAWASRFAISLLYGLEPGDPITLAASAVTLAVIGTVAGWIPAHRASRLDPTEVLSDV